LYETLRLGPSVPGSLHGLVPGLDGAGSLYLAVAILGATLMPHVIYLHSAMTKDRTPGRDDLDRCRLLRFQRLDVLTALGLAGLVNMSCCCAGSSANREAARWAGPGSAIQHGRRNRGG
jgi:manganese transport protein